LGKKFRGNSQALSRSYENFSRLRRDTEMHTTSRRMPKKTSR
jgi:hypothetical protein